MQTVTIDFETAYSKEYSLRSMTTEAYIRDPRFEVIGVAVKVGRHPTDWYSGSNVGGFLNGIDYSDKAIICHNTAFDGAILSWKYGINPRLWVDTMSMARPKYAMKCGVSLAMLAREIGLGVKGTEVLDAKGKWRKDFTPAELARYGQYCINDTDLTYELFRELRKGFPAEEMAIIDQTLRMYTEPVVELDAPLLRKHLVDVKEAKAALLKSLMGDDTQADRMKKYIMSNDMFAKLLRRRGVEPPMKTSAVTGKESYAFAKTDLTFLELQDHEDPIVQALVAARLGLKSTLEETRTTGLIAAAGRGPLPIMLNWYGAHTGRFSGGDKLNLQNLPSRGGRNTIRRSLKAPKGHMIVTCDSAQIEARMVAYIAGQDDLVRAFREGRDVYSEFASEVYGYPVTKADKIERFVGKTCILGLGYQVGAAKLRDTLKRGQGDISVDLTLEEAQRIVAVYRQKNYKIVQFWGAAGYALSAMMAGRSGQLGNLLPYSPKGILLPNKMLIRYPNLSAEGSQKLYISDERMYRRHVKARLEGRSSGGSDDLVPGQTRIYGGKVTENVTQALARIVIAQQMLALRTAGLHIAFQVHDENVAVVPTPRLKQDMGTMLRLMSTPPAWAPDLPVAAEIGYGANYGDAK